jgi:DNA end-binding protein Ku
MAPRANWKGFLRLSLVTCPVALYPATSESEKISFNQLNRATGHRIKYLKVDADTGEEVPNEDIVKGYALDKETFIEVSKEELENVALESTRTIEIDEFVDRSEIDPRYLIRPYYLRPDGKVGHDAFAVIRETIREMDKVAIGRVAAEVGVDRDRTPSGAPARNSYREKLETFVGMVSCTCDFSFVGA